MDSLQAEAISKAARNLGRLIQNISSAAQILAKFGATDEATRAALDEIQSSANQALEVVKILPQTGLVEAGAAELETPAPAIPYATGYAAQIANPEGLRELILIVDDESFVTLLAQSVLSDEGYRVLIANDGFEALKIYEAMKDEIALVVLDFTMPVMDGAEVFAEIRRMNPEAVVMVSSGFTEQERLKAMLAKGLKGFLPKPYTKQKLVFQIRSALDAVKR